MDGTLWGIAGAMVLLAAVLSYAVTRRYGWGAAVGLPVSAIAAVVGMTWQDEGLSLAEGFGFLWRMVVFVSPVLAGVGVGILLGLRRRA